MTQKELFRYLVVTYDCLACGAVKYERCRTIRHHPGRPHIVGYPLSTPHASRFEQHRKKRLMARSTYPTRYQVTLSGPAQGCDWEGTVDAFSERGALLMAGAAAQRDGVLVVADTWVEIGRVEVAPADA